MVLPRSKDVAAAIVVVAAAARNLVVVAYTVFGQRILLAFASATFAFVGI